MTAIVGPILAHEVIKLGSKVPKETIMFLHGMLGRRANMRSFARRFLSDKFQAVLVDHRGHGDSSNAYPSPHTLDACVSDLDNLVAYLIDTNAIAQPPSVVIGHSFGGKVALKYRARDVERVKVTWSLDSAPAPMNSKLFDGDNRRESVVRLKSELRTLKPWKSKSELVKNLTDLGFSNMVAQWMTTNVKSQPDGALGLVFDLDMIDQLFDNYCTEDLFPTLTEKHLDSQVYFLRAGRNKSMWTDVVLQKFETYVDRDTVHLTTLPKSGHFVHAEDPDGVVAAILPTLEQI